MIIYSLLIYTIFIILIFNKIIDILEYFKLFKLNDIAKVIIFAFIAIILNITYHHLSIARWIYSLCDYASLSFGIICLLSLFRIFFDVGLKTNYKGKIIVLIFWLILALNTIGYFDFIYDSAGHNIFIFSIFIAILYIFDRSYGVIMFIALLLWIIIQSQHNIYFMGVDFVLAFLFPFFEVKNKEQEFMHDTLLIPKRKK